jgi:hypothetical protein
MDTLPELFMHFLKDVYYAERQVSKSLPKLAKAAQSPELKQAFTEHRAETTVHIERLQKVFEILGKRAQGVTCEAINGLIEECEELLEEAKEPSPVRDAGLIACGQAIEHYEMGEARRPEGHRDAAGGDSRRREEGRRPAEPNRHQQDQPDGQSRVTPVAVRPTTAVVGRMRFTPCSVPPRVARTNAARAPDAQWSAPPREPDRRVSAW